MKVTILFDMPEDQLDLSLALNAGKMMSTITDVDQMLRNQIKHGSSENDHETIEKARAMLSALLELAL